MSYARLSRNAAGGSVEGKSWAEREKAGRR